MDRKRFAPFALILFAGLAYGDDTTTLNPVSTESYIRPPKEIEEAVIAPWYLNNSISNISPDLTRYLVSVSAGMPKLVDMAKPYHNLAGVQIDWLASRSRALTTRRTASFEIRPLGSGGTVTITPPKGASVSNAVWSPDGKRVAYFAHFDKGTYLYVADAKSGKAKQASNRQILATLDTSFDWMADSEHIAAVFVPANRTEMPVGGPVASGPRVQVSDDKPNSLRTYASLMSTPEEERLLEWHATGQLGVVDLGNGRVKEVGKPAMIRSVSPGPKSEYFRVSVMERPFSYLVPASNFPSRDVLWDVNGKQVVEFDKSPLREGRANENSSPKDDDKRAIAWRPDGAGLSFLQVAPQEKKPATGDDGDGVQGESQRGRGQRGGPGNAQQPNRADRVMLWVPPYGEKDIKVVYQSPNRISRVQYSEDCKTIFIAQNVGGKNQTNVVRLDEPTKVYKLLETQGDDFYNDQGSLSTRNSYGGNVVQVSSDGKYVYLSGTKRFKDPTKDAPRPFLDKVEIETGKKERVFESSDTRYETVDLLDDDMKQILVSRQSPSSVEQTFLVNTATKSEEQLTANKDYAPDLSQATVKTFTVTRNDGIKFTVKVTLPAGARAGSKLPAFFWFYPSEFTDQAAYDRTGRNLNKNSFRRVSGNNKAILLRAGYALVEPDCPIIGASDKKNDRNRLAIGGHSYGAFSTLNAMVHTPFFKAGIAGDGNYNRVLTPFGFQSEGRQLWESREVYLTMSPILYLDQLTGAILLYHGIDDQNMGTDPINSPRLFQALEALGKNAALYMYPYEDHGQIAEETVLDEWARFVAWLDKWVKNAK